MLAALTHFSGIFCVTSIAACEALSLLTERRFRPLAQWCAANAVIGLAAAGIYRLWEPIFLQMDAYTRSLPSVALPFNFVLLSALNYHFRFCSYLLLRLPLRRRPAPGHGRPFPAAIQKGGAPRIAFLHAALGLTLSIALYLSDIYPAPAFRHSLWLLPLLVPAAGYALADILAGIGRKLAPGRPERWQPVLSMALFALLCVLNLQFDRFGDQYEYAIPGQDWIAVTDYLKTLGPDDVVFAEKDDGMMLGNLYPFMNLGAPGPVRPCSARALSWRKNTLQSLLSENLRPRNPSSKRSSPPTGRGC